MQNIPMKIYALASYEAALDANAPFIFEITKLSIEFYESKFDVPYPFTKYDTAFCHEYAIGAMENPGMITFNDTLLYTENVSIDKMVALGVVVAHECSHNWFGDLVTMKWFDDTWLKESFADFMAYSCIDAIRDKVKTIPAYSTGWLGGLERAVQGYREDQLSTTHPVRSLVPNTSLAKVYFDGITYRKGMMTLKQLSFIMGQDNFYKGVHIYFTNFAWSNGTIDDFLASIAPYFQPPTPALTLDVWK
jgi:aminopeptidase N